MRRRKGRQRRGLLVPVRKKTFEVANETDNCCFSGEACEPQDDGFSLFDAPLSPTHDTTADAGVDKGFTINPSAKVVTEPSLQAEDVGKKTTDQIFDTVDSSDNLIFSGDLGNFKFATAEKQKSPAAEKASGSAPGGVGVEEPSIQPGESELEFYYRTYTEDWSVNYHRPPWNVVQEDDISTDPSACRDILGGLGTPFEVFCACGLSREHQINQLSSMLVGSSIMANAIMEDYKVLGRKEEENARLRAEAEALVKAAREGAEQLKREKAAFEQYKQTEEWAATAGLKQVRTLAKLLSDERKSWKESLSYERKTWKESWAKQNETLFRVRQELTNVKAANAALVKEKAAAEVVAKEAKEAKARAAKALEEENADRTNLSKTVEGLQNRVTILAEVTARGHERLPRLEIAWFLHLISLRQTAIGCVITIVGAILDAPENAAAVEELKQREREAGFKAGYNQYISHMNLLSQGKFTDERSGFHGVDTKARLAIAVAAYNDLSISALEEVDKCLEAEDYVDRLRSLYGDPEEEEEEETAGNGTVGAGTSGTKKD
ncbi:hypothetical protein HanRHA438_Chr11g0512511 [Helianthus annuus]|nr:hypothetical protein HanRHA438_Chr11g0512511 [Helianthus annuus]